MPATCCRKVSILRCRFSGSLLPSTARIDPISTDFPEESKRAVHLNVKSPPESRVGWVERRNDEEVVLCGESLGTLVTVDDAVPVSKPGVEFGTKPVEGSTSCEYR